LRIQFPSLKGHDVGRIPIGPLPDRALAVEGLYGESR
jgi:hypothetical protein